MSKSIFGYKKALIKQISNLNNENNNLSQSVENIIENYSKEGAYINNIINNNSKNDISVEIKKHYSPPPPLRSPVLLPKIQNSFKKVNNSQKKLNSKNLVGANSFANINHHSLYGIPRQEIGKKILKKDRTQISILENNKKNNNNSLLKSNNNEVQQINNITNINIHIYSNNTNQIEDNLKNNIIKSKLNKTLNNKKDVENLNNEINNTIDNITNINNLKNKSIIFSYKYKKDIKKNNKIFGNIKLLPSNPFNNVSFDKKNNNKSLFNNNNNRIIEKELNFATKKYLSNSLPDININKERIPFIEPKNNKLNSIGEKKINNSLNKKINNEILNKNNIKKNNNNNNDNLDIDTSMNFLRDISGDNTKFILFLKLIQNHIDIAILIDSAESTKGMFRKKASNILNNESIFKLNSLLNMYFNILTIIYYNKKNNNIINNNKLSNLPIDCFFLFPSLNNIFHKIIKIQICLYSSILVTLSQLGQFDLNNMMKNYFNEIIKEITSPLIYFFEYFIKEDINLNYPDLIKNNLKPDFLKHINKLSKNKKKAIYKNSEILLIISKNINKAFDSMKNYLIINLKYSLIKPFGEAVFQMITSLEKRNLYQFASIFLKTILYGELEINKKKVIQNSLNFKAKFQNLKQNNNNKNELNNNYLGSSFINNVREIPPFLPPINQRYKYTLVLDMDETLVHFFFAHINGMFFVRPYCFEFLNELNNFYEIITFTAATKEYADNILNQLDLNDNIIKFRLYRQHITIMGFNVYKDLNKIGRDLSKIIIIDNLKENFKIQPNNGIFIKTWISDVNDTQFKDLLKILKDIAISNVDDVRPIIQKMNENIIANGSLINPYSSINIQKIIEDINNKKK